MRKTWVLRVLVLGIAAVGIGCGGSDDDNSAAAGKFEFVNNSGGTVTVTPGDGESFNAFALAPGQSADVKYEGESINFFYSPGSVRTDRVDGENIIIFN